LIGCEIGSSSQGDACWRLNGPGINGEQRMQIRGVPEDFFTRRQRRMHYPLGFDTVFVSAGAVIGLPRTTGVTRCT
jgi:alpha-D-ribose 1-methylphosphonate 5-triphosphate synthase subunit PhnH